MSSMVLLSEVLLLCITLTPAIATRRVELFSLLSCLSLSTGEGR